MDCASLAFLFFFITFPLESFALVGSNILQIHLHINCKILPQLALIEISALHFFDFFACSKLHVPVYLLEQHGKICKIYNDENDNEIRI